MKIFFANDTWSPLADSTSPMLRAIRMAVMKYPEVTEVMDPDRADVIVLQEKGSFKDFRYIDKLLGDPIIGRYPDRVFTVNNDDWATGLLRGLYTSLPRSRFNASIHVAVPFMTYPNEQITAGGMKLREPRYLAAWRGNTKSNRIRPRLVSLFKGNPGFCVETTSSWLNHNNDEKNSYLDVILDAKFSLCPAGWAPVTYRIYESMALGRCPVIIADDFVPPQGPDWGRSALFFPERALDKLEHFLDKHEHVYGQLGATAYHFWQCFFSPEAVSHYYAQALLNLVKRAPVTDRTLEIGRWRSLHLYWTNRWTLPQRMVNRVRRWTR